MPKLKIELKQHTPLIHFQSEQPGATLRATEVKPKLDKFLIEHVYNRFDEYKQYLIGYKDEKTEEDFKDKKAFDYKLRIINVKNRQEEKIEYIKDNKCKSFPNYFGNMGKEDGVNKFVYCDSLELEMFSLNKDLLETIGEKIPLFLMTHNFGQRQSKGFGSFFINSKNMYHIDKEEKQYEQAQIDNVKKMAYKLDLNCYFDTKYIKKMGIQDKKNFYKEVFKVFQEIEKLYTRIRSGGETSNSYIKEYAKNKNIIWEKDVIRDRFAKNKKEKINNAYLIKDLLGLSVEEQWKDKNGKKFSVKKEHIVDKNKIERMKSPIFFKPLKNDKGKFEVYLQVNDIPKEFWNQKFEISKCIKTDKDKKKTVAKFELETPQQQMFNIKDFYEFIKTKEPKTRVINECSTIKKNHTQNNNEKKSTNSVQDSIDAITMQKLKAYFK